MPVAMQFQRRRLRCKKVYGYISNIEGSTRKIQRRSLPDFINCFGESKMGHTLVARFDDSKISAILPKGETLRLNKIPFGRNCDREKANAVLPYHMTIMHWAKEQDFIFLPRTTHIQPQSASIQVDDVHICAAECGSLMLYLQVSPSDGYHKLFDHLNSTIGLSGSDFPHITLVVDQDYQLVQTTYNHLRNTIQLPFSLDIKALELYHIWNPTVLVNVFPVWKAFPEGTFSDK